MDFNSAIHVLENGGEFCLIGIAVSDLPNGISRHANVKQWARLRFGHNLTALILTKRNAIVQTHHGEAAIRGRIDNLLSLLIISKGREGQAGFPKVDLSWFYPPLAGHIEKGHLALLGHQQRVLSPFIRTEHRIGCRW